MRTPPLLLVLALSACTDTNDHDPAPKYGELGVGAFLYRCPASGDPTCPNGTSTAPDFPSALALGSQLELEYTWQDDEGHRNDPLPELQSATSARLRDDGIRFTALEPGFVALIAITGNSEVVDFVHLEIAEIDELRAIAPADPFPVPLVKLDMIGTEERDLQGLVVDRKDRQLGGILPYSWASEDPAVLEIVSGSDSGLVRVRAVASGATNLVLTQGEHVLTLPVAVEPGSTTTDATTGGSSGADTDATGTTADTDATGTTTAGSTGTTGGVL